MQSTDNYVPKNWVISLYTIDFINPYSDKVPSSFEFEILDSVNNVYEYYKSNILV